MRARLLHLLAGAAIAVAATSGVALATGGSLLGPDGRITACVHRSNGSVRIVADESCRQAEQPLAWNQVGPAGPQGVQGAQGAQGAEGARGERGPAGEAQSSCELERRIAAAVPGFVATAGCVPTGPPPAGSCDDGDPNTIDRGTPPACTHERIPAPQAEMCNGVDDDRDGTVDEHDPVPNAVALRCGSNGEWLVAACGAYWDDSNGAVEDGCERRLLFEPNNTEGAATPIPYGGTISAEILPAGDLDVFRYQLSCTFFRPCRPHVEVTGGAWFDVSDGTRTIDVRRTTWDGEFTASTTLFLTVYAGSGATPEFTLTETH